MDLKQALDSGAPWKHTSWMHWVQPGSSHDWIKTTQAISDDFIIKLAPLQPELNITENSIGKIAVCRNGNMAMITGFLKDVPNFKVAAGGTNVRVGGRYMQTREDGSELDHPRDIIKII